MHKMRRWYAFVGPTFPGLIYPGLHVLPPVKRGDVLKLLESSPEVIIVADGFFGQQASVMHRELLEALRMGVRVVGCSSMGALRAAELHEQGMIGVGKIFEMFRSGRVTGDDEVAMLHGPAELHYCEVTFPLCNLRTTVEVASKIYTELREDFTNALREAAQLPYFARTLSRVGLEIQKSGSRNNCLLIIDLLRQHWIDQKRLDLEEAFTRILGESIIDDVPLSRVTWPETSWLRLHKQNTKIEPMGPAISLIQAIVQFYDPNFERYLLSAFTTAILSRLQNSEVYLDANGFDSSSNRLIEYLNTWPASDVGGAIGAAVYLQPNSTLNDWMQSPPQVVSKSALLDWARQEFSVLDYAHTIYKLSPSYQLILTCSYFIEHFNRELPARQRAWTNIELWKMLKGNRLWLNDPTTAARQFLFEDSDEMLAQYKHLAAFEVTLFCQVQTPLWGVNTRNVNCISDLVSCLGAMKNE